ncbi:MAG: glycosyltransferase [Bacteroidales bacterium]|jgi:glycosyltransferase involved in cell wall biosynthesis|nr:glycosyltransferase [Bacteroidales bacterium]
MKILHTIPGLSVNSGGPTTCTYNLVNGLRQMNVDVDVLTFFSKNPGNKIIAEDAFIKALPDDTSTSFLFSHNFKEYLINHNEYDLYHANALWTYPSHITLRMAVKKHKACLIAPHGMLFPQALQVSKWKKKIASILFQRKDLEMATCLQATSSKELEHFRTFGLKNPVAIIPNSIRNVSGREKFNQKETSVTLGFMGRFHPIKNIEALIEAFKKINPKDCNLVLIGSGDIDYENSLKKIAGDDSRIRFTGFLQGDDMKKILGSLSYLVLPSHSENFGMVVPEALSLGIPVIASKGTPWEELDTYHCGWWVSNDMNTLAQTIEVAINTPETERVKMGENGRKLVIENYSTEVVAKKMKQLYEWILYGGEKPDFVYL